MYVIGQRRGGGCSMYHDCTRCGPEKDCEDCAWAKKYRVQGRRARLIETLLDRFMPIPEDAAEDIRGILKEKRAWLARASNLYELSVEELEERLG
jgi:hypothetical protein